MAINVRIAEYDDIETLIQVRFDYFFAEEWEVSPEQRSVLENTLRSYFERNLNSNFIAVLAEDNGEVASVAFLAVSEMPANVRSFPTGKTGTILNVLTYPKYRRQGYATNVLNVLLSEAKKKNLSYIELSASESGKPLYQTLGFSEKTSSKHFTPMRLSFL